MRLYDAPGDVESKAKPASVILGNLPEPLEDRLEHLGGDPRAAVGDRYLCAFAGARRTYANTAALRRELDCVRQQVREHLQHAIVIEGRHHRPCRHPGVKGDVLEHGVGMKHLDGLSHEEGKVAGRLGDRQLSGVDACDVEQIADQPVHPRRIPLNPRRSKQNLLALVMRVGFFGHQTGAHDNAAEQVAEVVADDAQEVVAVGERIIRADSLRQQVPIGLDAFQRQQFEQRLVRFLPFALEAVIGLGALVMQRLVFSGALVCNGVACRLRGGCVIEMVVRFLPRFDQYRIGGLAGMLDDGIGVLLDGGLSFGERSIGLLALSAQAFVGQPPLGTGLVAVVGCHCYRQLSPEASGYHLKSLA